MDNIKQLCYLEFKHKKTSQKFRSYKPFFKILLKHLVTEWNYSQV